MAAELSSAFMSAPRRAAAGTATPLNTTSAALWLSTVTYAVCCKPALLAGTRNSASAAPMPSAVRAATTNACATGAWYTAVALPFSTQPSAEAVAAMGASVDAAVPPSAGTTMALPSAMPGSHCAFWSAVPNRAMARVATTPLPRKGSTTKRPPSACATTSVSKAPPPRPPSASGVSKASTPRPASSFQTVGECVAPSLMAFSHCLRASKE